MRRNSNETETMTISSMEVTDRNDVPVSRVREFLAFREWCREVAKSEKSLICRKDGIEYWNVPFSFDIETTSFMVNAQRRATMYAFVFGVFGKVFVGRYWDDFILMYETMVNVFGLGAKRKAVIWVHNLGYEFQWIRMKFRWTDVFAIDDRRPVRAETKDGLIFRCSYYLSGYSLEKVGEHLTKHHIEKMVGDLDYSVMRNSETPLTLKEWRYIYHDGLVVMAYIAEEIEKYTYIHRIPLTKTGVVRRYMKDCCLFEKASHKDVKSHKFGDYRRIMMNETLDVSEYRLARRAFQGGFTHCNAVHMGVICEDVQSMDFTSSYPSVMIAEKYPCTKGKMVMISSWDEFIELDRRGYLLICSVRIHGLSSKEMGDHPISVSDDMSNTVPTRQDNGRIVDSDLVSICATNIDLKIYKAFYDWESIEFGMSYIYMKDYLPTDFVKGIISLYKDKTRLKGVEGKEREYMYAKENLNSCYGMCVTDISREKISYDNEVGWMTDEKEIEKDIKRYNESKSRFISYLWGVFVTAYARRNLFTAIYELKDDYIYADTDSVKYCHPSKHKKYFDDYNENEKRKLKLACERHGIPFEDVSPKTIKGKVKTIGLWDDDGHYARFKTLGAKRYLAEYDDGHLLLTIAGVGKKAGLDYLRWKYRDNDSIFRAFSRNLVFPSAYSPSKGTVKSGTGKQTVVFLDEPYEGVLIDFRGVKAEYREDSGVYMESASYSMGITQTYIDFVLNAREVRIG